MSKKKILRMQLFINKYVNVSFDFIVMVFFLTLIFFTGGSSRFDVQSLVILYPTTIIVCGIYIYKIEFTRLMENIWPLLSLTVIFFLALIQILPLPGWISSIFLSQSFIDEIYSISSIDYSRKTISYVPSASLMMAYFHLIPVTVFLIGIHLQEKELRKLLFLVIVLGIFSAIFGLLQIVGGDQSVLRIYRITNHESAVGLLANRNHQAVLLACLFPVLAVYGLHGSNNHRIYGARTLIALSAGTVLIPLIFITGSRAGLFFGALALISTLLWHQKLTTTSSKSRKFLRISFASPSLIVSLLALLLSIMTVLMARAEAFQRLWSQDQSNDLRFRAWEPILEMAIGYFPFGSGLGSFAHVYQVDEGHQFLSYSYLNQAHNDWLDLLLTGGLPGLFIVGTLLVVWYMSSINAFHGNGPLSNLQKLGSVLMVILALSSAVDYPLRTPIMASVFAVSLLWLTRKPDKYNGLQSSPKDVRIEPLAV